MTSDECTALRQSFNLSYAQFATILGVNHGTVRNWEQKDPQGAPLTLMRLLRANPAIMESLLALNPISDRKRGRARKVNYEFVRADWDSGEYTQEKLAERYDISVGLVKRIIRNV